MLQCGGVLSPTDVSALQASVSSLSWHYRELVTTGLPIKMLHDRVLVKMPRDEGDRRSSGGILIPATAQVSKRLTWAEVLAIGNHVRAIEVGDRVLFSPDEQHEVEISGDDYLLLRERDIHAVAAERVDSNTGLYL
ncbi:chaperonin GroES [Frankineae bacterium MT45]|nr:chaperonin GroES [Frankineae bacterium MT45]